MTTEQMLEVLREEYPELLTADGFDDAIIGIVDGACRSPVVCYDYQKCVQVLVDKGMDEETAAEYLDFNTLGAYVGEYTPLFVHDWRQAPPWYEVDLDEDDEEKKETRNED